MAFSFLLRRSSLSGSSSTSRWRLSSALGFIPFSAPSRCSSSSPSQQHHVENPQHSSIKTTLSARMNFVFDQIDALERDRNEKDETLQRIRAWREKKQKSEVQTQPPAPGASVATNSISEAAENKENLLAIKEIEVVHPWAEWVEFMEQLVRQNYFDHRRRDEDQTIRNLDGDDFPGFAEEGVDFTRDFLTVRTACVNFGRDRFDILRSLSRKDIQVLVGHGCPCSDSKVVISAKVLRKYVHLDEGDVCSSCSLRTSCNRAYLLTRKEDEARTLDVIRVLLTFGFDPINGSVENKPLMKMKSVKAVVRKLLYEIVKLSSVPIDPNLPPPIVKKPPPKIKQPPPPPKKRVGRDDIEMKKGDWLCPKCDFMNFAKNTVCLQCDAKRPKRQLLPGEWECPECNFLNYRRNMVCFHCEHKRPPDEYMENQVQEKQSGHGTRLRRLAQNPGVSDAWNFDFDDNESDGADVAAFEFADSPKADGVHSMGNQTYGDAKVRGFSDEDSFMSGRAQGVEEGDQYSEPHKRQSPPSVATRTGFDDFDDEDDDDIDSYELDTSNNNQAKPESTWSESDAFHHQTASSHFTRGKSPISNSGDSDLDLDSEGELSDHSSYKSSHAASSRHKSVRGHGRHMGLSFGSDDDMGISFDADDNMEGHKHSPVRNRRKGVPGSEDEVSFGSDSESEGALRSRGSRTNVRKGQSNFRGDSSSASARNNGRFRLNGSQSNERFRLDGNREKEINSYGNRNNHNRDAVGSRRNEGGVYREKRDWGQRKTERTGDFRSSDGPRGRDGFGNRQRENFSGRRGREGNSVNDRPGDFRSSRRNEGGVYRERRDWGQRKTERTGDFLSSDGPRGRDGFGNRQRENFSGRRGREGNSVNDRPGDFRSSRRNEGGVYRERRDWGQRKTERTGDFLSSDGPRGRDGFGNRQRENFSGGRGREGNSVDDRPCRRRIIER